MNRRPYQRDDREHRPSLSNEELDPALTEVSRRVIGCAIEVHKALGPGFDPEVYLNALSNDLRDAGVSFSVNHEFPVQYNAKRVGAFRVSMFVDNRFLVSVMADEDEVGGFERTALRAQLRASDLELGLIINFNRRRLKDGGLVRVLNPDKIDSLRGGGHDDDHDHDMDDEN